MLLSATVPGSVGLATGDLDDDGDMDLVTLMNTANTVLLVNRNNGDGSFATPTHYSMGGDALNYSLGVGDFDLDGDLDLCAIRRETNELLVFPNHGDGTFGDATSYDVAADPIYAEPSDIDGDGDLDIVVTHADFEEISVFENVGNASLLPQSIPVGGEPGRVVMSDIDGDGHRDLVHSNLESHSITMLMNDGRGGWGRPYHVEVGDSQFALTTADVDGDGDTDIGVVLSDSVKILLNDGEGHFSDQIGYEAGNSPIWIAFGDFDGDGDVGFATTSGQGLWGGITVMDNGCL
jgi:hypothetical protein